MREGLSRFAILVLITAVGGGMLYWLGFDPPTSRAGWVGAGLGFFVWVVLLLSAFGRELVRFFRVLLGIS